MPRQKRVITIQDISCIGKCSLTVALPILSAAGIETSILPTAILSTHTGGFSGYTFRDLTEDVEPIAAHWKTLDIAVDAIYTGYLGSEEQLALVQRFFAEFRQQDTVILVDPAMADQGKLYPAFDTEFALGMRDLCTHANIIAPNITEATLMLEKPYPGDEYNQAYIEQLLRELAELGPRYVVLTGISFEAGKLGAAAYDRELDRFDYAFSEKVEGYYHGTGDIYSSALLAALLNNKTLAQAIQVAVDFTVGAIRRTREAATDPKFGVDFEHELGNLIKLVGQKNAD
ncbi:MAG: pyridoxamine kinase [Coriobacteriales bacterium]|jgi:pyridoxine kinase|nr:pyridoxamine kinase [Coriobacteriales bacterium]